MSEQQRYRIYILDLSRWTPFVNMPKPKASFVEFATKEEAMEVRKKMKVRENFVYSIAPAPPIKKKAQKPDLYHMPRMTRKMT